MDLQLMNDRRVLKFTEEIYELLVRQKLQLDEALRIMAGNRRSEVSRTAEEISKDLENGCLFSLSLSKNQRIKFDEIYVLFVTLAEKTGKIQGAFEFLFHRETRKNKNRQKLLEVLVYPCFVVLMAVVSCVLLVLYGKNLLSGEGMNSSEIKWSFLKSVGFLVVSSVVSFYLLWMNLKENKLYEAFLAVGFLVAAGTGISQAVGYGMLVVGPYSRAGRRFARAKKKLEYGMSLENAFELSDDGAGRFDWWSDSRISEVLYFARCAGRKTEAFEKIALELKRRDEKKQKLCLCLVEPVFICITGIFLLLLAVNLLLPFMNMGGLG